MEKLDRITQDVARMNGEPNRRTEALMERQCDAIRQLYKQHPGNREAVIKALASGLDRGKISRISNTHNWSNHQYAEALWRNYANRGRL
jgi:hypothetical protein